MTIRASRMTKKEALSILDEVRKLSPEFLRSYDGWQLCPECNHEFQEPYEEGDYPTDLDLVYEYIEDNIKE